MLAIQTDPETQSELKHGLGGLGFAVDVVADGGHGVIAAHSGNYELILLDLLLPGSDSFDVLGDIRQRRPEVPLIVLTALGGVENRVHALEAGAVDYVAKPFSLIELAARIRAQVRQARSQRTRHLSGAGIEVDLLKHEVVHRGVPIHVSPMEFRLLAFLMQRPGIPQTRGDILRGVWGDGFPRDTNLVDVYIGYLRRKLSEQDPEARSAISTVRSLGYRFVDVGAPVSRSASAG